MGQLRYCGEGGLLVGGEGRLPEDLCEYNKSFDLGCNRLRCGACREWVRGGPPGVRSVDGRLPRAATLFATENWLDLPQIEGGHPSSRLYTCKCSSWEESWQHSLVNDHESPSDPDLPWRCGGHETPQLPVTLGELTVGPNTDWPDLVQRIFEGICPRKLHSRNEGPSLWLCWLYSYLRGLPEAEALAAAIAERIDDPSSVVTAGVLRFFRWYPQAEGIERLVARAESAPDEVAHHFTVAESNTDVNLWDVLIAALTERTGIEARVVAVVRKVTLMPLARLGSSVDVVKRTLESWLHFDAWAETDLQWMAEHIAGIEAAGTGRWQSVLNLLLSATRRNVELDYLIVIGGTALIQSGAVDHAAIGAWLKEHGRDTDAWVPPLEVALQQHTSP